MPAVFERVTPVALVAAATIASGGVLWFGLRGVSEERQELASEYRSADVRDPEARRALREKLRLAVRRHPGEPYFPRLGALLAWRGADQDPMPWIQRALERAMTGGRTHYLLAQILAARGASKQALLELRFATEYDPGLADPAARLAVRLTRNADELVRAAPQGSIGAAVLHQMALVLSRAEDAAARERCLDEAILRAPGHVVVRLTAANHLLEALGSSTDSRCKDMRRAECERRVVEHADALERLTPELSHAVELRGRLLMALGRPVEAERLLSERCGHYSDRGSCSKLRVKRGARHSRWRRSAEGGG